MSKSKDTRRKKRTKPTRKPRALEVPVEKDQSNAEAVAAKLVIPAARHGHLAALLNGPLTAGLPENDRPGLVEFGWELQKRAEKARSGDLSQASDLLFMQAVTLDSIFSEMGRIAAQNISLPDAADRYMRLAMKAQAGSRQTLEALAKLHQPREQTVRHVHVNEGGQAIVADEFHNHTGDPKNGETVIQSHEPGPPPPSCAALPCEDATGDGVPVPQDQRSKAVPAARRPRRSSTGQS